jgi:hypothetical protein
MTMGNHNYSEKNLFHCHIVHQIPTWANLGPDPVPVFVVDKVLTMTGFRLMCIAYKDPVRTAQ